MSAYRITPTAERQLKRIRRDTIRRWGDAHAQRYFAEMDAAVRAILIDADLARPRTELHAELRARRFKAHILYVAIRSDGLVLVAVLHRAMNARASLASALRDLGEPP